MYALHELHIHTCISCCFSSTVFFVIQHPHFCAALASLAMTCISDLDFSSALAQPVIFFVRYILPKFYSP